MLRIRTIIVDDEYEAREGVKSMLENDEDIQILQLCKNGIEAIDMINEHKIDLMFLDIQMPVVNGFEVVNSISKERLPHVIFVTAYDQYAVKAFEVHAIDYILKPFTNQRFKESLLRAKQLITHQKFQEAHENLKNISEKLLSQKPGEEPLLVSSDQNRRLVVKQTGKVFFVPLAEIIWLEAYDYYVKIHVKDHFYLIRESLKKLTAKLPETKFIRIHKSSIVNVDHIKSIVSIENGDYKILIDEKLELKVSRSFRNSIKSLIT